MESRLDYLSNRLLVAGAPKFMWTDLYPVFASLTVAGYVVYQFFAVS